MNRPLHLMTDRETVRAALEARLGPVFSPEVPRVWLGNTNARWCDEHGLVHAEVRDVANGVTHGVSIDPRDLTDEQQDTFNDNYVCLLAESCLTAVFN